MPGHRIQCTFFLLFLMLTANAQAPAIGQWREHLPWSNAIQVISSSDKIWCATSYSLFSVDKEENSIERWSKVNGLHETGIAAIGWDNNTQTLIAGYSNSIIDLVKDNEIKKIDALFRLPANTDKSIKSIFTNNGFAYISTGIGILLVDINKGEVKDTYIIGTAGNRIPVFATTITNGILYAASSEGLKTIAINSPNISDYRNWKTVSGTNGLSEGAIEKLAISNNQVLLLKKDSIFRESGSLWNLFYTDGKLMKDITVGEGKILVSEKNGTTGNIVVLNATGTIEQIIQNSTATTTPMQAAYDNGDFWIADSVSGLSKYSGSNFTSYKPNSVNSVAAGYIRNAASRLWVSTGSLKNLQVLGNKNGLSLFTDETWTNFSAPQVPAMDSLTDCIPLAIDQLDGSVWAGSFGGGLFNITTTGTLKIFKQNSPIQPAIGFPTQYRVSGLAFDASNNLWISNHGAAKNLHVKKADGNWLSYSAPYPIAGNELAQVIIDDQQQKWIIAAGDQGLLCFNHGSSLENSSDDRWKWLRTGKANGNLPDNGVLCIAKDKNGFIWVGTKKGIGIFQCAQEMFTSQGCDALLPIVQQDNFAGYLFRDEEVQCITVDGADRKWIGTQNGVWLISADAEKTIYRFTTDNSPLPDNDIKQIGIDEKTGEVFISTAKGMVSFRSTATEGTNSYSDVLVFPNPVPPDFSGSIAIRGLANNSIVKITELDGRLVYETRALGGQAIWNGKNYKGQKISTGIYLVISVDDSHKEKMVSKIVFIGKQ